MSSPWLIIGSTTPFVRSSGSDGTTYTHGLALIFLTLDASPFPRYTTVLVSATWLSPISRIYPSLSLTPFAITIAEPVPAKSGSIMLCPS